MESVNDCNFKIVSMVVASPVLSWERKLQESFPEDMIDGRQQSSDAAPAAVSSAAPSVAPAAASSLELSIGSVRTLSSPIVHATQDEPSEKRKKLNGTASPEPPTRGEVKDESKEDLTSPSENVEICETSENVETRCVAKKSTGGKKRRRDDGRGCTEEERSNEHRRNRKRDGDKRASMQQAPLKENRKIGKSRVGGSGGDDVPFNFFLFSDGSS